MILHATHPFSASFSLVIRAALPALCGSVLGWGDESSLVWAPSNTSVSAAVLHYWLDLWLCPTLQLQTSPQQERAKEGRRWWKICMYEPNSLCYNRRKLLFSDNVIRLSCLQGLHNKEMNVCAEAESCQWKQKAQPVKRGDLLPLSLSARVLPVPREASHLVYRLASLDLGVLERCTSRCILIKRESGVCPVWQTDSAEWVKEGGGGGAKGTNALIMD